MSYCPELEEGGYTRKDVSDDPDWTAALSIRPHHFLNPLLRNSLTGDMDPGKAAELETQDVLTEAKYAIFGKGDGDIDGYFFDVLGKVLEDDVGKRQKEVSNFFAKLASIPNESVISLCPKPDGICHGCFIGNHCTAVNTWPPGKWKDMDGEAEALWKIYEVLNDERYKEGIDFTFKETAHVVYDYNERYLSDPTPPSSKIFHFKSMLVKAGVLRRIAPKIRIEENE